MEYSEKEQKSRIKQILENADICFIYTGAGMGVDSGLSVFRGDAGLWEKYPQAKSLNMTFKDLANPQNYLKYPDVVIPFYVDRYKSYLNAEPHNGYYELFGFAKTRSKNYYCITSNVDGLLEKSGFNNVYNLHGSIHKWQCSARRCAIDNGEEGLFDISNRDLSNIENLRCDRCNEYLRPNLLMFYDFDWVDDIYEEERRSYDVFFNKYYERYSKKAAIIEIGAGSELRSIRSMAEDAAYSLKTQVIRINPEKLPQDVDDLDVIFVHKGAAEGVSYIMELISETN